MAANGTSSLTSGGATNSSAIYHGWKASGTDRGSVDIIWDCLLTIVLCCWVSTHPNVPSPNDKRRHRFIDKFNMACIGLAGPDYLLAISMGQFANARRSVKLFAEDMAIPDGTRWSLTHGFFADMGGFYLKAPDYPQGFPVTSEQLYYLVKHGYVEFPSLTKKDIKSMSQADTLSKVIVVWQVLWFCVTELQRARKGLPMTTLELTALSFSFLMVATSAFWLCKPTITAPVMITTQNDRTIDDIRAKARQTTHPDLPEEWHRTPLYFISGRRFQIEVYYMWLKELTFRVKLPAFGRKMRPGIWDRIPDDVWLPVSNIYLYVIGMTLQLGFGLSFLISWNFYFPTSAEQAIWRFITVFHVVYSLAMGLFYLLADIQWKRHHSRQRSKYALIEDARHKSDTHSEMLEMADMATENDSSEALVRTGLPRWIQQLLDSRDRVLGVVRSWRNLSSDQDPSLEVNYGAFALVATIFVYLICRLLLYVEDILSMRKQPEGIYITVNRFIVV